jgi:drug/metabolite transporter (DMT)-like permease
LLVIGNAMALISDVFIKLMEPGAPIFQFAFLRCVITLLLLLPLASQVNRKHLFTGLKVHAARAHIHLVGLLCMVIALANLPLATANAVFYAAPILVMVLAALIFKEKLSTMSVIAVFSGFGGIVVILRPAEFNWAAIAALAAALTLAINAVMVRKLPKEQTTVHKLLLNYLLIIPAAGALALWEGAALDSSILISAEYTGLIWAVLIGWIGFNEMPDLWFAVGSAMIVVPLILVGLRSRDRSHRVLKAYPSTG